VTDERRRGALAPRWQGACAMWKWVLLMTVLVIATGVAVMFVWTAINHLLAGQGATVNWPQTIVALLFIVVAAVTFAVFANRLALGAESESISKQ
jgi:peptidoglycan biosynthesis protein MviN/MurJ (putative lipid II flippase)